MTTHTKSVDVAVPVHTAYNQWTQFTEFPEFMEGVERVDQVDDTHTHWVTSIGGVRREFDAEITEQHPDERVAWKVTSGPKQAGVVTVHRIDDTNTRIHLQMDFEPEGIVEKAGEVTGAIDSRIQADLNRFKNFIERRGTATGQWRGDISPPPQNEPNPGQAGPGPSTG
ncbi:polyketide cyclase/dehydrase/lipid transport protein [Saccharopolyspora erythraea NRRL 2338]|uniref:Cyclase/dehydrase n=2 Tax=Saccharopolyspora erythraea TaxID=1836 RepID=A4FD62_SACEN|nr:SRPBCC family protein [Saccharopolyspora erythraea]EQD86234.1 cyclase [Saccharopolyspora erythraea D]PFG95733.1 polyketide cyclase/dehydrase/lipid transport protein [Saccharopolyspora erythraea NRRL 2338]QRK92329.1 SRPBCC family protein [Saccharopolyspora erythraea]CAM01987.1 cyclase/dehydrase [Saccharopolyspora erythraea NRRL 2338]